MTSYRSEVLLRSSLTEGAASQTHWAEGAGSLGSLTDLSIRQDPAQKVSPNPQTLHSYPSGVGKTRMGQNNAAVWLWVRLRFASILSPGFNHLLAARSRASESSALPDPHCPYLYKEEKSTHCRPKIRKSITGGSIFF